MQLIGMLDSPYVRRAAISIDLLGLPFELTAVSVFTDFEQFRAINPVVKAPTLICDDGTVLMDSTLIIDYAESLAGSHRSLMPSEFAERVHALRLLSLALAACEKAVQLLYERNLRPPEKHHEPWLTRVRGQLLAAFGSLESEVARRAPVVGDDSASQAALTIAVAWRFVQMALPRVVIAADHPALRRVSETAERLPAFVAYPPIGPGVPND